MRLGLWCATSNAGKLREFQHAAGQDFLLQALPPQPCPEEGRTFEQNAVSKGLCYSRALEGDPTGASRLVFADDSGLEVDALGGAPGVWSARFAGPEADDEANNRLLLAQLDGLPASRRTARFVCCIALCRPGLLLRTFHGEARGRILEQPLGSGGFGYDPLFYFPPLEKTFAQLSMEEKGHHSHRGQAFRQMLEWIQQEQVDGGHDTTS
jgi:XTP/dITP diphosphohydrolase